MLVCPKCKFRRRAEAGLRLETCPRCGVEGHEVYLVKAEKPVRVRRLDLVGLMSTAREELSRVRSKSGERTANGENGR